MDCTQALIQRAQQGDHRAFEAIYAEHKQMVFGLCLRIVRDVTEAEDMAQEVFIHLFRFLRTFRGDCKFTTWLHRVCVTVVYCKLRKKRLTTVSIDQPAAESDRPNSIPFEIQQQDSRLTGVLDRTCLERAIESLPPGYRLVFVLHDVYGYEHREIAEVIGYSIGNSKSQLHKARLHLRTSLQATKETVPRLTRIRHRKPTDGPELEPRITRDYGRGLAAPASFSFPSSPQA